MKLSTAAIIWFSAALAAAAPTVDKNADVEERAIDDSLELESRQLSIIPPKNCKDLQLFLKCASGSEACFTPFPQSQLAW